MASSGTSFLSSSAIRTFADIRTLRKAKRFPPYRKALTWPSEISRMRRGGFPVPPAVARIELPQVCPGVVAIARANTILSPAHSMTISMFLCTRLPPVGTACVRPSVNATISRAGSMEGAWRLNTSCLPSVRPRDDSPRHCPRLMIRGLPPDAGITKTPPSLNAICVPSGLTRARATGAS